MMSVTFPCYPHELMQHCVQSLTLQEDIIDV